MFTDRADNRAAIPVGNVDPNAPTGPKLRYNPPPGRTFKQVTLTQLDCSLCKKKSKERPVAPPPREPVAVLAPPPKPEVVAPVAALPPACTQDSDNDCTNWPRPFSSDSDYEYSDAESCSKSSRASSENIEKEWMETKQRFQKQAKEVKVVTPPKGYNAEWRYNDRAKTTPFMSVPLSTPTNSVALPITTDMVNYAAFGYLSADKHSRDILLIDVLMPPHPASGITPTITNGGKQIVITYELRNGLHNEERVTSHDPERQYAMRSDFRRYKKLLHNGGAGATLTQVINLPFVCHTEFFCEEDLEQGWRLCVEPHVNPDMRAIGVPEVYLCMQLLKQGKKKLKRASPEIYVKTTKKILNYKSY